jgi:pimeloyl-ACP methyl ester carboxylesterase
MDQDMTRLVLLVLLMSAPPLSAQDAEPKFFESAGVEIAYADEGTGTPVLLLHGFTGSYERHWRATGVIEALRQAGYRVVAMDARGHGRSGKPHETERYGLPMVDDAIRLLDHLGITRAHVVGYSMGGAIANQLLVRHSDRLRTVTLIGAGWEGEAMSGLRDQLLQLAVGLARGDAEALVRAVLGVGDDQATDAEIIALSRALFERNDPQALAAAARQLPQLYDIPGDKLRKTTLPVLAIVGEHDRNVVAARRMAEVVQRMEIVEIPGATHASSVKPAAGLLVLFLNRYRDG